MMTMDCEINRVQLGGCQKIKGFQKIISNNISTIGALKPQIEEVSILFRGTRMVKKLILTTTITPTFKIFFAIIWLSEFPRALWSLAWFQQYSHN